MKLQCTHITMDEGRHRNWGGRCRRCQPPVVQKIQQALQTRSLKKSTWNCFILSKTNNFSSSTTENLQEVTVLPRGKAEWKCPGGEPFELCDLTLSLLQSVLRGQRCVCRKCPGSAWLFIHHVIIFSARSSYSCWMWGCLVPESRLTTLAFQERESQL